MDLHFSKLRIIEEATGYDIEQILQSVKRKKNKSRNSGEEENKITIKGSVIHVWWNQKVG